MRNRVLLNGIHDKPPDMTESIEKLLEKVTASQKDEGVEDTTEVIPQDDNEHLLMVTIVMDRCESIAKHVIECDSEEVKAQRKAAYEKRKRISQMLMQLIEQMEECVSELLEEIQMPSPETVVRKVFLRVSESKRTAKSVKKVNRYRVEDRRRYFFAPRSIRQIMLC